MKIRIAICGIAIVLLSSQVRADSPTCNISSAGPYCRYEGTVAQLYVNSSNRILLYFDTPLDLSLSTSVGITGVRNSRAATVMIDDNPTFAQYFYSTALAAQARGSRIVIQMQVVSSGLLMADRIWVLD